MKWTNKGHEFDELAKQILEYNGEYYIYGAALAGKYAFNNLKKDINILSFIDSDTTKIEYCEKTVLHIQDLPNINGKIIVASAYYLDIKKELEKHGLKENKDFYFWKTFIQVYMLYKYDKVMLFRVDISLTNRCTLKCKYCNMFMPHFENPQHNEKDEIIKSIDNFFDKINHVNSVKLLGGEPFLYKQLSDVINHIQDNYNNRFDYIEIFTNATIIPSEEELKLIQKYNIQIQITDYTKAVDYTKKLNRFVDKLKEYDIKFKYYSLDLWLDFGFPHNKSNVTNEQALITKFSKCNPDFRGLVGDKYYFCHLSASAEKADMYKGSSSDYIVLDEKLTKKELIEFDLGYSEDGYVSFCSVCRGCNTVNNVYVNGNMQLGEKL